MSSAGFEIAIPAIERPQIYGLDRTATGTGYFLSYIPPQLLMDYINQTEAFV